MFYYTLYINKVDIKEEHFKIDKREENITVYIITSLLYNSL